MIGQKGSVQFGGFPTVPEHGKNHLIFATLINYLLRPLGGRGGGEHPLHRRQHSLGRLPVHRGHRPPQHSQGKDGKHISQDIQGGRRPVEVL
jgi:hypothetical protein